MQLHLIDYSIRVIYVGFVVGIGFALKRYMKTSADFFLSGRSVAISDFQAPLKIVKDSRNDPGDLEKTANLLGSAIGLHVNPGKIAALLKDETASPNLGRYSFPFGAIMLTFALLSRFSKTKAAEN